MEYYPAYICTNGHAISTSAKICLDAYCAQCGAPVISNCPHCSQPMKGHRLGASGYYIPPAFCSGCGNAMPWTKSAIDATIELIKEDDQISLEEQVKIIDILPDVVSETPRSQLASIRIRKALKSVGKFTADAIREFIINFGCELIKNQILS